MCSIKPDLLSKIFGEAFIPIYKIRTLLIMVERSAFLNNSIDVTRGYIWMQT